MVLLQSNYDHPLTGTQVVPISWQENEMSCSEEIKTTLKATLKAHNLWCPQIPVLSTTKVTAVLHLLEVLSWLHHWTVLPHETVLWETYSLSRVNDLMMPFSFKIKIFNWIVPFFVFSNYYSSDWQSPVLPCHYFLEKEPFQVTAKIPTANSHTNLFENLLIDIACAQSVIMLLVKWGSTQPPIKKKRLMSEVHLFFLYFIICVG